MPMQMQMQFHLSRLFIWMSFFAVFFACFSWLPSTPAAFSIAIVVASLAFFYDLVYLSNGRLNNTLSISYFLLTMATTVVASYVSLCILLTSSPPRPPVPFFTLLYLIVSGDLYAQITRALGQLVFMLMLYFWAFCISTIASVMIALPFVRRYRSARLILFANAPSLLFLCYAGISAIMSS